MELNAEDLCAVTGGGFKLSVSLIVGAVLTLLIGIVDGYLRPLKCNK